MSGFFFPSLEFFSFLKYVISKPFIEKLLQVLSALIFLFSLIFTQDSHTQDSPLSVTTGLAPNTDGYLP